MSVLLQTLFLHDLYNYQKCVPYINRALCACNSNTGETFLLISLQFQPKLCSPLFVETDLHYERTFE